MAKAVPVSVTLTVVLACALFGVTLSTFNWGVGGIVASEVSVAGAVGVGTVGEAGATVVVGTDVNVSTVSVGGIGVEVSVGASVGVMEVGDGIGDAVGVITMGLPNSLQPRSGAAPMNPVRGEGGTNSPFAAAYCVTPLSIAGEVP